MRVEVAVIGRGMIGSAAARHLAERGVETALVGPLEPADRRTATGPYASHHDQGRITRVFGRTPVWSVLAARSIARYDDIATRAGIEFYVPAGCAVLLPDAGAWIDNAAGLDLDAELVTPDWLLTNTGIAAPDGVEIAFERSPAGHIDPRRLVAAQAALARAAGAVIVEDRVDRVTRAGGRFTVGGPFGELEADRVLLATGAFGGELLDGALVLERRARTTLMVEMAPRPDLPCVISVAPDPRLSDLYWVPPVRYPDGRTALKIGGALHDTTLLDADDLDAWFHGDGDPEEAEALAESLVALLPDVTIGGWWTAPCVITATPTDHPYIGWVDDGVAVAIGGNGAAAKSSDELGRLASTLFDADGWTDELASSTFAPVLA